MGDESCQVVFNPAAVVPGKFLQQEGDSLLVRGVAGGGQHRAQCAIGEVADPEARTYPVGELGRLPERAVREF